MEDEWYASSIRKELQPHFDWIDEVGRVVLLAIKGNTGEMLASLLQFQNLLNKLGRERTYAMGYPKDLPDPTQDYADFIIGLMKMAPTPENPNGVSDLTHYRAAAGKDFQLHIVCVAQHISQGMRDEILEVDLITTDQDERINSYKPLPGARLFWENGLAEKMSPQEIIDGWKAMQSITKDVVSGEDEAA